MNKIYILTGAPGAGKTQALSEFLKLNTDYIAFDVDWILNEFSDLAGKSVVHDQSTWKPFRKLWFEILHSILRNGKTPILFASIDKKDVEQAGPFDWCDDIEWLLLDCSDEVRRGRLKLRGDMTEEMIDEAIEDASKLREEINQQINTEENSAEEVAKKILELIK